MEWYVTSSRQAVNWGTVLPDLTPTIDIYRLVEVGDVEQMYVWARAGSPVTREQKLQAVAAASTDAVPARPGEPATNVPVQGSRPTDGMTGEWRDEMTVLPGVAGSGWQAPSTAGSVVYGIDGNAAGAGYLKVTLDPRDPTARFDMIGVAARAVQAPFRMGWGVTWSRRSPYQHTWFGQVGVNSAGVPIADSSAPAGSTITGGVVIATNVATVTTTTPHGLVPGMRVVVAGISDPRLNTLATVLSIPAATQFTYAYTFTNGTYGTTGTVTPLDASLGYRESLGVIVSDATSGNAVAVARAEGIQPWATAWNPGSTWQDSIVPNNVVNYSQPYTYAHQARFTCETMHEKDWTGWSIHSVDSGSGVTSQAVRDQTVPFANATGGFVPRIQARNLPHLPAPIGPITAASKSGTTTATLTIPNHGLTTSDWVDVYGIRDQTNFANQATAVQVASVVNTNQITVAFGASATATSYGGVLYRTSQNTAPPALATSAIQSITTLSTGRTQVTFGASQGSFAFGESICLVGLADSGGNSLGQYEGLYRVANTNTATFQMELDPMQGQAAPATTTCGGTLLGATDVRVHFVRAQAHARIGVEIESSRAHSRGVSSVPVITTATVNANIAQVASAGVNSQLGAQGASRHLGVMLGVGTPNVDRVSGALTASGNSGTIADDFGQAISGVVNVTAVSGTAPILDVIVQDSYDGGATYQDVYWLPRITATGTYQIPPLSIFGRRRFNYIVAGTSPSFTFSINVTKVNQTPQLLRQLADRAIAPNTLGSASAALYVDQCSKFGVIVTSGAGATVSPVYGLQLSTDGTNWADAGLSVTVPASSTVGAALATPWPARYARLYVKTAGTAATQTVASLTATT